MRINGIIAEYNPFHNGHKYHLELSRQHTGADFTIIVMSGSFVQRGAPALLSKYVRAEMALRGGADLVLELPAYFAAGSAEYFASGAAALLDKTGVADYLCFGSECGQTAPLMKTAEFLLEEPEEYRQKLQAALRQGKSYPAARAQALKETCPEAADDSFFNAPNNILGIEYCRALLRRHSRIVPFTIQRNGTGHHDLHLSGNAPSSASALRRLILSEDAGKDAPFRNAPEDALQLETLQAQMPAAVFDVLCRALKESRPLQRNDFSQLLHYKLLSEETAGYEKYADLSKELSDRIRNRLYDYTDFSSFCELLKSKDMTYTRISRCLLHILLGIEGERLQELKENDYVPYARILGLRRDAAPLLSALKAHSSIPLVSKPADAKKLLSDSAYRLFQEDIRISHIYNSIAAAKSGTAMQNEYRSRIVTV